MCFAACQIKAGEERGLVMALRRAEAEIAAYRSETDEESRKFYAREADHARAVRQAEESGYNKGVADMRAELAAARGKALDEAIKAVAATHKRNGTMLFVESTIRALKGTPNAD